MSLPRDFRGRLHGCLLSDIASLSGSEGARQVLCKASSKGAGRSQTLLRFMESWHKLRTIASSHALPSPLEASEGSDGAQICILHDVLRIVFVLCKPFCEIVRCVQMFTSCSFCFSCAGLKAWSVV